MFIRCDVYYPSTVFVLFSHTCFWGNNYALHAVFLSVLLLLLLIMYEGLLLAWVHELTIDLTTWPLGVARTAALHISVSFKILLVLILTVKVYLKGYIYTVTCIMCCHTPPADCHTRQCYIHSMLLYCVIGVKPCDSYTHNSSFLSLSGYCFDYL